MMAPDPLRSATTVGVGEDTSLALPSDSKLRSGQQRVLDQVHSIKRSKSKYGKSVRESSPSSPTSPTFTKYDFASFKFSPTKTSDTFQRSKSIMSANTSRETSMQKNRSQSTRTSGGRYMSTSGVWEQQMSPSNWPKSPNGLKPSQSDPTLAPPFSVVTAPSMRVKGQVAQGQSTLQSRINRHSVSSMNNGNQITSSQSRMVQTLSNQSHNEGKMGTIKASRNEQKSMTNAAGNMPDLTLKEAVEFLSHSDENYQQWGATFIQHTCYSDETAKSEVFRLKGIPALVTLLRSPNSSVSQAAAGALRNLVFKNQENKVEVQNCGGIAKALQLLKETNSTETQKQVTGLLWNLSSSQNLRKELTATAGPALTEFVVVPFTGWSDSNVNNASNVNSVSMCTEPDVFYCATGCLRNLSCGEAEERKAMRKCPGLIESLVRYMQSCVAEDNSDDKSLENCACILHNLSYRLEQECPESFAQYCATRGNQLENKSPIVGCFSPKSSQVQKKFSFDTSKILDDSLPSGVKCLSHPKSLETYMSVLESSKTDGTLEACCGALQNLTATRGDGSDAVSQILVSKLRGLYHFVALLKSPNQNLKKAALSLLGNMSKTSTLQPIMAKEMLPHLTEVLKDSSGQMGNSDETVAGACSTMLRLMSADSEGSKKLITNDLVNSLIGLSENGSFPKSSNAASVLLHSMWNDKNLQSAVKKLGFNKSAFINGTTKAAYAQELSQLDRQQQP